MRIGALSTFAGKTRNPVAAVPVPDYEQIQRNIPDLLALWLGTEDSGSTMADGVGSLDATITGTVTFNAPDLPADMSGGAINFAGTGSASVTHDSSLALSAFTLSFWFSLGALPAEGVVWHIITKELAGRNLGDFMVRVEDDGALTIQFQAAAAPDHVIGNFVQAGTTYHLCIRADNGGFDAFLNGLYLGENTGFTGAWSSNTNALQFAASPFSAEPANAVISPIALYERVLTEAEVVVLAQVGGPPVANDDVATVPESATTSIDVLANDEFVGSAPTVEIVAQPSGGDSVAVNGLAIDYTAGAVSADTERSFQYRFTDLNGPSNTATAIVTVQNSVFVPVTNANCFQTSSTDTVEVSSMAALVTAVNAAPPGRQILIAPGTYNEGTLRTFNNTGTAANPIVIRPRDGRGTVTISAANWTLANASARLVFANLYFSGGLVRMNGDHNRITRCRFRNISTAITLVTSRDGRVDHCDFRGYVSGTGVRACIHFDPNGFDNGTNVRNLVDYNIFADINPAIGDNGQEIIRWHGQEQNIDLALTTEVGIVEYNRFDNIRIPASGSIQEGEVLSIKSGGWKVRFNTFTDLGMYLQLRHTNNSEVRSNWFESMNSSVALAVAGDDHLVIGNRFVGAMRMRVQSGTGTNTRVLAGTDPINIHPRAEGCQIIGNQIGSTGTILIGGFWSSPTPSFAALDNNLFDNTKDGGGDAHSFDSGSLEGGGARHSGTTFNDPGADPEYDYVAAVKIPLPTLAATDEVGMFAPDPKCLSGPQS